MKDERMELLYNIFFLSRNICLRGAFVSFFMKKEFYKSTTVELVTVDDSLEDSTFMHN